MIPRISLMFPCIFLPFSLLSEQFFLLCSCGNKIFSFGNDLNSRVSYVELLPNNRGNFVQIGLSWKWNSDVLCVGT